VSSVIQARGLRKIFRTGFLMRAVEAVKGVDLDVAKGEIFGFIGPNGAGKTTTIKMLTGLIRPSAGEATIHDIPVTDPRSRQGLGFMPEGTYFHEYLTGAEFLDFHGRLLRLPKEVRRERIPDVLERVGMTHAADLRIGRYSKGMRQRVGLAQAMIGDPDLLILDEPMSGLDPFGRKDVRDMILRLREEGKTIFVTSHILADAEMICDQVAIILGGRIVHQGYLGDLLGEEIEGAELMVESISQELFEELATRARRSVPQGARFLFDFAEAADAEKALDLVRERGGRVRSLVPKRRSLEDLMLAKMTRQDKEAAQ
jgi:ABC-2 type transport system ATP-binding protein